MRPPASGGVTPARDGVLGRFSAVKDGSAAAAGESLTSSFDVVNKMKPLLTLATLAGLCLGTALVGCGGDAGPAPAAAAAATHAATRAATRMTVVEPLLDNDGRPAPSLPGSEPADPGARTRTMRYATPAQAAQLEQALGAQAVRVEVGCCDAEAVATAEGTVAGLRAAHGLDADAPVLVHGSDLRQAAAVANRLEENGHAHVWLVTR